MKNVVVAQSGGPTSVINASLLGVIEGCRHRPSVFGTVFGAVHGIEGILREELLDLSAQDGRELRLLRTTPACGAIGTCRYKIRPVQVEDMDRVIEVFSRHDVGAFFYIGGNDSMDTANRVGNLAKDRGLDLLCVGIPKTVDNDLGDQERLLVDHTPGYGSVARYWAELVAGLEEENRGSRTADPVVVVQAMGRRIGYIAATARLADPTRRMPLQIFLPEGGLGLEDLAVRIERRLRRSGRVIAVVSEGIDVGSLGERRDAFGHVEFAASQQTSAQCLVNYLNREGLPVAGSARWQMPGTEQRHAFRSVSSIDLREAYDVGRDAVRIAEEDGTGYMATIRRAAGRAYRVEYGKVPLEEVAGRDRRFPAQWISEDRDDVTDSFVEYASPLLGDGAHEVPMEGNLPRFARLEAVFADKRCAEYVPQGYRVERDGGCG